MDARVAVRLQREAGQQRHAGARGDEGLTTTMSSLSDAIRGTEASLADAGCQLGGRRIHAAEDLGGTPGKHRSLRRQPDPAPVAASRRDR